MEDDPLKEARRRAHEERKSLESHDGLSFLERQYARLVVVYRTTYDGPELDKSNPDTAIYTKYVETRELGTDRVLDREGTGQRYEWNFDKGELEEYFSG